MLYEVYNQRKVYNEYGDDIDVITSLGIVDVSFEGNLSKAVDALNWHNHSSWKCYDVDKNTKLGDDNGFYAYRKVEVVDIYDILINARITGQSCAD